MDSISSGPIADLLAKLHQEAEAADRPLIERYFANSMPDSEGKGTAEDAMNDAINHFIESENKDLKGLYSQHAGNFLAVSPQFGRFLYACARANRAQRIIEFGSSMGISTIYLAAAVRDNMGGGGGGLVIGTELESTKAERARANLDAAGLAGVVEIRVGDARETLEKDIKGEIDMVLLDGAFTLYMPVLKLLEPHLRPGALIIGENCFKQAGGYVDYVSDPRNGYMSVPLPFEEGRGNLFSVKTK